MTQITTEGGWQGWSLGVDVADGGWLPTQKQCEFMVSSADEVLFGGAAGVGKTDALVMDAPGLTQEEGRGAITHPRYRALMIRPSLPELREVIGRCQELYPNIVPGAEYRPSTKEFRFPSGATIEYNYLEADVDKYRYRGREFQYIGWEELTQHPDSGGYTYLLSRARKREKEMPHIKVYIRATTNPGDAGHDWVRNYWQIPDDGGSTFFKVPVTLLDGTKRWTTRQFITARISDNKHVDPSYEMRLAALPAQDRRGLYEGRWDIVDIRGQVYKDQIKAAIEAGRWGMDLPILPHLPVHTAWDLGSKDRTAIWLFQEVDPWLNLVWYMENTQKALGFYVNELETFRKNMQVRFGIHHLPHDADHKTMQASRNQSIKEMLKESELTGDFKIVPKIQSLRDGIAKTRKIFSQCRFGEACGENPPTNDEPNAGGLSALKNYRYRKSAATGDFTNEPLHNWASNGADAFRQIAQGYKMGAKASSLDRQMQRMGADRAGKQRRDRPFSNLYPDYTKVY